MGLHPTEYTQKKNKFGIRGRMADHLFQILLKSVKGLLGCDGQNRFSIELTVAISTGQHYHAAYDC